MADIRAAFETWMSDSGKWPQALERSGDGYVLMQAHAAWTAWQAAWQASLAHGVQPSTARDFPPALIGERIALAMLRDDVKNLQLHPYKRAVVRDWINAAIERVERELQDARGVEGERK